MATYTTNLKTWGDTGSEYPNGYSYLEGEQPVDAWDNFTQYNAIEDIKHLIDLTNTRLESSIGTAEPVSPEDGEMVYRTDLSKLKLYDASDASWHTILFADNAVMEAPLDMGGYALTDTTGRIQVRDPMRVQGANLEHEWFNKQEGGTVAAGAIVPIGTFGLAAGEKLQVTQAMLTEDGFTSPAPSGIDLVIADQNSLAGDATTVTSVLAGDGTTLYDNATGSPLASYTNSTAGHMTVIIGIDNGYYTTGVGADQQAHAGFIARVE